MKIEINIYCNDRFWGIYKLILKNNEYRWVYAYDFNLYFSEPNKNLFSIWAEHGSWDYQFCEEHLKGEGVAIPYGD